MYKVRRLLSTVTDSFGALWNELSCGLIVLRDVMNAQWAVGRWAQPASPPVRQSRCPNIHCDRYVSSHPAHMPLIYWPLSADEKDICRRGERAGCGRSRQDWVLVRHRQLSTDNRSSTAANRCHDAAL